MEPGGYTRSPERVEEFEGSVRIPFFPLIYFENGEWEIVQVLDSYVYGCST